MCAVIRQGILGGFSNKIGSVVGSSWKGIAVMKSLPLSVANPKTAAQVEQRTDFAAISKLGSQMLTVFVKPLWDRFAQRQSGYNAFIKRNIEYFAGGALFVPNQFVISQGKMASTTLTNPTATVGTKIMRAEWVDDSGEGYKLSSDLGYAMAWNETKGTFWGEDQVFTRLDEQALVEVADMAAGNVIWLWVGFKRFDGTVIGNSSFTSDAAS